MKDCLVIFYTVISYRSKVRNRSTGNLDYLGTLESHIINTPEIPVKRHKTNLFSISIEKYGLDFPNKVILFKFEKSSMLAVPPQYMIHHSFLNF